MKIKFLLMFAVLAFFVPPTLAKWKVQKTKKGFLAHETSLNIRNIPLKLETGKPTILSWKKSPRKEYWILTYEAGAIGSHTPLGVERAAVIKKSTGKVIIDKPLRYIPLSEKKFPQPKWTWKKNRLVISDPNGHDETVNLN